MWHLPIHIYGTTKQLTESGNYSNAGLSAINGGSAPRDNLYSPDRQQSIGHIDEPQRHISSEDLVT